MESMHSHDVLNNLSLIIIEYLDELTEPRVLSDFSEGQITAFVECLEIISSWKHFKKFGIANIEEKYPLSI